MAAAARDVGAAVVANLRWSRIRNLLPWVNDAAIRRRRAVVLEPYRRVYTLRRELFPLLAFPVLSFGCLLYGFFFALTAPYLLMQFLAPIAVLGLVVIWALPNQRDAPTYGVELLFAAFLISFLLWPDYLAIYFPGMPWITSLRITAFPMVGLFLICLSVSKEFRKAVGKSVSAIKIMWILMCVMLGWQFATIPLSPTPVAALQIVILITILHFSMFVVSATIFRRIEYVERYWALLCVLAIPICIIVILEARQQHLLWMTEIPRFLRVPDENVTKILEPEFRPGINLYRAKGIFRTPLVLAEYLCLLTPFLLHFGFSDRKPLIRAACFLFIPIIFVAIRLTDSRLGMVGMLISILLFGCFWSYIRWRREPKNLFSAAVLFAYPAAFILAVAAVLSSTRLSIMVFGGGAQASSTAARSTQLDMALRALAKSPLGHGPGRSGEALGFAEGQFKTVDNYFITVAMDGGVIGIVAWYGIFIAAIVTSLRYCLSPEHSIRREANLLAPLTIALCAFLVVKWVHGQGDLHSIQFIQLGMISALVYRMRREDRLKRISAA